MPVNGKCLQWEWLEFGVGSELTSSSHSGDGTGVFGHAAQGVVGFTPNIVDIASLVQLSVSSSTSGSGAWSASYRGPNEPFGGLHFGGTGFRSDVSITARFTNVRLYIIVVGALIRIFADNIEIYVNGALEVTLGGVDLLSDGTGPCYSVLNGVPIQISGSCTATTETGTLGDEYDYRSECQSRVYGGWRYQDGHGTESLPVILPSIFAPSVSGCPFEVGIDGIIVSEETWGDHLNCAAESWASREQLANETADTQVRTICGETETVTVITSNCIYPSGPNRPAEREVWEVKSGSSGSSGSIMLVADLEKSFSRINTSGFAHVMLRGGMPYTRETGSRHCNDGGIEDSASVTNDVHPSQSPILFVMGSDPHAGEDTLSYPSYAPVTVGASRTETISYDYHELFLSCLCPLPDEGCVNICTLLWPSHDEGEFSASAAYNFPSHVETNSQSFGYLYHDEPIARYLNYWANPHWSYVTWRDDWNGLKWAEYWGPARTQKTDHSSLPEGENGLTRIDLISDSLEESGNTPFLDHFVGGFRWPGMQRFRVQEGEPPAALAYTSDSEPLWSVVDDSCELSFDSTLAVSFLKPVAVFELDIGSFTEELAMYPHFADRVFLNWNTSNVSELKVYFVSRSGEKVLLEESPSDGETTPDVEYRKPFELESCYAGSWGIDNGLGVLTDQGVDLRPVDGASAQVMAHPETCAAFPLLFGRGGTKIRFEVTPVDPGDTVEIDYPEWRAPAGDHALVWESGHCAAIVHEDGPAIRWGNWLFFNGSTLQLIPDVAALGYKSTIIDWLCFRRLVLEGHRADHGLDAELVSIFDAFEGQSVGQVDQSSIAVPLLPLSTMAAGPWRCALVSTRAEVPPWMQWPHRNRGPDWRDDNEPCQICWILSQEPRQLIATHEVMHLVDPDETTVHSDEVTGVLPDPWKLARYTIATNESEAVNYLIRSNDEDWAKVTPWHGYFAVLSHAEPYDGLSYAVSRSFRHALAQRDGGTLHLGFGSNANPSTFTFVDTGLPVAAIDIAYPEQGSRDYIVAARTWDQAVYLERFVETGARDLSINLGTGAFGAVCESPSGILFAFRLNAGTIYGHAYDRAGNEVMTAWTTNISGADEAPIAAACSVASELQMRISLIYRDGGVQIVKHSVDGGKVFA